MVSKQLYIKGLSALAKEIGVNRTTLSQVAHGHRTSARLEAILLEHGIKVKKRK